MMTTIAMANTRGTELAMCNYPVVFFFFCLKGLLGICRMYKRKMGSESLILVG